MPTPPALPPLAPELVYVRCLRCKWPVGQMDASVVGAKAGGLCTRCTRDDQQRRMLVYTVYVVVPQTRGGPDDAA